MFNPRPIEIFLIQFLFYFALWMWNDYTATMISFFFTVIFLFILIVSIIVEFIEPSKVPRSYFTFMVISILCPIIVGAIFIGIMGGSLDWLENTAF